MSDFIHEKIAVIGIGSTGCGVIDNMIDQGTQGIEFIGVSVGKPCPCLAKNNVKILNYEDFYEKEEEEQLAIDKGLSDIKKMIDGYDMVFILSDSTGSDGSWIIYDIVKLCKSIDILTISIVSDPLKIESKSVKDDAIEFKNKLKKIGDALIVLPSENIIKDTGLKDISIKMMYSIIQDYFIVTVKSIADILIKTGEIHIVFDDIYAIFNNSGIGGIGVGYGTGEGRCKKAYNMAINSFGPGFNLEKVKSILFIFTGHDLNINEVHETSKLISKEKFINEKIGNIWCMIDDEIKNYNGEVRVTIIGMGLNN